MREWLADARYALRVLGHAPGFTTVAVLSLALGVGANAAVFGVARAVLLDPLPVRDPGQLRLIYWASGSHGPDVSQYNSSGYRDPRSGRGYNSNYAHALYRGLRSAAGDAADVFGFNFLQQVNVAVGGRSIAATGALVSGNYFRGLGVSTVLGRPIEDADDRPGADPVAVISHGFWQRAFGGDPAVVGRAVSVNGHPFTIVGVTPPGFVGLSNGGYFPPTEVTLPLAAQPVAMPRWTPKERSLFDTGTIWWVRVMARLRPGASETRLQRVLETTVRQWLAGSSLPALRLAESPEIRFLPGARGLDSLRRTVETPLLVLAGVAGLVILIACINVASLVVARGLARQHEYRIRLGLGSGRLRLVRQMLTESLLLAAAGGGLGALAALWGSRALLALLTSDAGLVAVAPPSVRTLAAPVFAITCAAGLFVGLLPALRLARDEGAQLVRSAAIGASAPRQTAGRLLVMAQIAISVPLLVGAGLFLRTLQNLGGVELGFDPHSLVVFRLDPTLNGYGPERVTRLYDRVLERLETIPGVSSATLVENMLISGWISNTRITVEGGEPRAILMNRVGPRFFETMGMPLVAGRRFDLQDQPGSPRVAVINEAAARAFFGAASPLGRAFTWSGPDYAEIAVVGVVRDSRYDSLRSPVAPTMFLPFSQSGLGRMYVAVRARGAIAGLADAIRAAVGEVDPTVPVTGLTTQAAQIDATLGREHTLTLLLGFFGGVALLLACIGLYGVTAYTVARRTSEIGVRVALGARRSDVFWLILRQALILAGAGLLVGVPLALAATRTVRALLFGVEPDDPASIAATVVVLLLVAVVSGVLPARRAARLDPLVALRHE